MNNMITIPLSDYEKLIKENTGLREHYNAQKFQNKQIINLVFGKIHNEMERLKSLFVSFTILKQNCIPEQQQVYISLLREISAERAALDEIIETYNRILKVR